MSVPLISRKLFFGSPDRASVTISPDGRYLAWLAPLDGVLNVWVAPRDDLSAAHAVTHDATRPIYHYYWSFARDTLIYLQDKAGDENWRLNTIDLSSNTVKELTPFDGVRAEVYQASPDLPDEIMVGLNRMDPSWHDLYRLNLKSGALSLVQKNEGFMGYLIDDAYTLRGAMRMTEAGSVEVLKPQSDAWTLWETIPAEDVLTYQPVGFDKSGETLIILDSRGTDTSALYAQNYQTGKKTILASDPRSDAGQVIRHPTEKNVQAVSFTYERKTWTILDPSIETDLAYLRGVADGELEISSRSLDDRYWSVSYVVDDGPVRFYLYDRQNRQAHFLFTNRKALEGQPLVKMIPTVIRSSDGWDLVSYYSLPAESDSNQDGIPDHPVPLVLFPHGGPWGRDMWGYDPMHQFLANRGYAVLSVNFRSSVGLGKAFTSAGDREWGGAIIRDQLEAVQWAVRAGIADPARVAILGGSFGGYSTLAGLTFFPETYAAGVDLVGPANLITLIGSIPPYWKPQIAMFKTRMGDPDTIEGRALLKAHSPLTHVDRIRAPLLIGQGKNDPRVKQAESDQIATAMQASGLPVTYLLYPDEGHGFARPENTLSFFAIAEAFLAPILGGRFQPVGDDFKGSSLEVLQGKEFVPGLSEAIG